MKRIGTFVVAMMCMFVVNFTSISAFATDTGNKEADEIFKTYLETATLMVDDPNYDTMFALCRGRAEEWYIEYAGGTSEEWDAFTDIEVFCWDALYFEQITFLESGMYDRYYGSIEKFHTNALPAHYRMDEVQEAAYFEIMDWQYNYIITNGVPYNFMTGEAYSYFKENATTASVTEEEIVETTVPTIVESENIETTPVATENTEDTDRKNDGNVTIVVIASAFLLIGIGAGLLISKKKKKQ